MEWAVIFHTSGVDVSRSDQCVGLIRRSRIFNIIGCAPSGRFVLV